MPLDIDISYYDDYEDDYEPPTEDPQVLMTEAEKERLIDETIYCALCGNTGVPQHGGGYCLCETGAVLYEMAMADYDVMMNKSAQAA